MNLLIDIGNTFIKAAITDQGNIIEVFYTKVLDLLFFAEIKNKYGEIKKGIVCSVRNLENVNREFLQNHIQELIIVNENTKIPIKNAYNTPSTLGFDRLVASVGAHTIYPASSVLIIDFGTAITFDLLENSEFKGGNISLGLNTRFKALNTFTSQLPLYEKEDIYPSIGTCTKDAIIAGVQKGIIFEIEGYISSLQNIYPELKVIFTGGDAIFFEKKVKSSIFVVPNLIFIGLNSILEYNAKK